MNHPLGPNHHEPVNEYQDHANARQPGKLTLITLAINAQTLRGFTLLDHDDRRKSLTRSA